MTHKALIRQLQISCLGLDPIDPLRLLVDDVIEALTQPERTWVGLTDDEIIDVLHPLVMADISDEATDYEIARAIEAKLKQKNTHD
jgi:hypothetical protein